jgi:hypothetical protein
MLSRRNLLLACLPLLLAILWQTDSDFLRRPRARHVRETVFISAGNRRLAGFFDGVSPHPHWNAVRALRASR